MVEMLKSVFRIDMDYSARRLAQKYLQVIDPDYYEWETHILFDDAFELGDNEEEEQVKKYELSFFFIFDRKKRIVYTYIHNETMIRFYLLRLLTAL